MGGKISDNPKSGAVHPFLADHIIDNGETAELVAGLEAKPGDTRLAATVDQIVKGSKPGGGITIDPANVSKLEAAFENSRDEVSEFVGKVLGALRRGYPDESYANHILHYQLDSYVGRMSPRQRTMLITVLAVRDMGQQHIIKIFQSADVDALSSILTAMHGDPIDTIGTMLHLSDRKSALAYLDDTLDGAQRRALFAVLAEHYVDLSPEAKTAIQQHAQSDDATSEWTRSSAALAKKVSPGS